MSGKSKKRLQKRNAETYKKSAQRAIDDLKPWIVLSPRPLGIVHAQALIASTYGSTPHPDDIEIRVDPAVLQTDKEAIVVNVEELRKAADLSNLDDPLSAMPSFPVVKRSGVGLSNPMLSRPLAIPQLGFPNAT